MSRILFFKIIWGFIMSKISNYKEFKKHEPEYNGWKADRDLDAQKKVQYLKTNPIAKDEFEKDIQRAKVALNAVNIMDEYSQARAEDTEQVVQATSVGIMEAVSYASMGLAGLFVYLNKNAKTQPMAHSF